MRTVKSIGVFSLAKFQAIAFGLIGLMAGLFFFFAGSIFQELLQRFSEKGFAIPNFGMGTGVVVLLILPLVYALIGFITGMVTAIVFNIVAGISGGIKLRIED